MLKKSCAILISIALAMGVLVHSSFAFSSWGNTSIWYDVAGVTPEAKETIESAISANPNFRFMAVFSRDIGVTNESKVVILSTGVLMNRQTSGFGLVSYYPDLVLKIYTIRSNGSIYTVEDITQPYSHRTNGGVDYYYYKNSTDVWYLQSSGVGYATYDFVQFSSYPPSSGTTYVANLIGAPWQDNRDMIVSRDDYLSSVPYLTVRVNDIPYPFMFISVHFYDQFGPGTAIFDIEDLIYYPGDDYQLYAINPNDVSFAEFHVTSVIYSGSTDWGYKELDNLDIIFNEPELPDPIPSVTPVPDYNYFDTSIINYNGGQKDIFYNSFQVNIKRFEDSVTSYFFVDDYGYLNQPFSFNFILLPYYPVQQGFLYDDFIDDCFYQYDVILSEYYDAYFDFFYGAGALNSLQNALSSYSSGADISGALENWYSSHSPVVYTYPYFDDSDLFHLSSDMPALLVVTDSFYFKQTNYLLGDTGTILSEFSDRFYKVDGFVDNLFGNMLSSYNLDLAYYENASRALTSLSYWLNDNSLDNLSYLVNIDTDLHELLEWFQNQDDPDVLLALPYFNPSLLEELYGLNIGELIQFFNGFVQTLPSFDYSDFPDFFTYANGVVDDVAGSNDSVIDNILDPYEYDDSGLSTFGWD